MKAVCACFAERWVAPCCPIGINKTELAALRTSWRKEKKEKKHAPAGHGSGEAQAADSAVSCVRTFSVFRSKHRYSSPSLVFVSRTLFLSCSFRICSGESLWLFG